MAQILCVGHAVQDYIFQLPELPSGGRKFAAKSLISAGGGPAASAAVAIARLGAEAALAARIGDDAIAAEVIAELEAFGVNCANVRRMSGRRTSLSAVVLDAAGERMIINYRDPAYPEACDWISADAIATADAVLADSRWPTGAAYALGAARRAGKPAVLDADDPTPTDAGLLGSASHIAFSADGLRALMRCTELREALEGFARASTAWCCVTDGPHGVLMASPEGLRAAPAFPVDAVDTLGAGDTWHGAFTFALASGQPEADAVSFASAAAAIKVSRNGGRDAMPTFDEVIAFMSLHQPSVSTL